MASLSNINGLFDVHSTGAILFSTSHGTSGQILRSNGNAAPTWVTASTVIGGPYLPLTGGTLSGPLAGTSATFSGMITVNGGGIDIDNNDDVRLRFDNAGTFLAGLQVATTAGDMISSTAINDFAVRSQANLIFSSGGNTERMRIGQTHGDKTFISSYSGGTFPLRVGYGTFASFTPTFVIADTGNVGIGETLPSSKLDVVGANTSSIPLVELTASGTGPYQRGVRLLNGGMGAGSSIMYAVGYADNARNMGQTYFHYAGAGSTSNRISMGLHSVDDVFNILGTGNVGIGTTDPGAKLSIRNNGVQLSLQRADAVGTEWKFYSWTSGLNIFPVAASEIYIGRDGATTNLQLHNGILKVLGTGDSYFTGNVGIGTTLPYERLSVNGVVSIRAAYNDPNMTVTSNGMTPQQSGSLEFNQGFAGTTTNGDTIVFKYEATSWKSWQFEYCISAAYGLSKGGCGGYANQSMQVYYYVTTNQGSNVNVTSVVATNSGANNQHVIVTITGNFGIHPTLKMKYTQGGGDGYPRADRASLTFNS